MVLFNQDGTEAVRRPVRLGRRNNSTVEIIDGLNAGDRVITSAYASYLDMQVLTINP
jgi:HlyD family secretion protein